MMGLEDFVGMSLVQKQNQGILVQEIIVNKLAMMMFVV